MFRHTVLTSLIAIVLLPTGAFCDQPPKTAPASVNELSMEVAALQTIYQFRFTPAQMTSLRKLAQETADDSSVRQKGRASDRYRQSLVDLHAALVSAKDDALIDRMQEKMDTLRGAEDPELDDGYEVTESARERAPEVFRQLSARQVVAHLALYGTEFPDPLERILDAMGKVRGLAEKEWKETRDQISEEVGRLVAGLDVEKASKVGDLVVQLLIQARALKEDEFKKERPELEKQAKQIIGSVSAMDVMRHVAEQALAELLSNPRLSAALEARLKK